MGARWFRKLAQGDEVPLACPVKADWSHVTTSGGFTPTKNTQTDYAIETAKHKSTDDVEIQNAAWSKQAIETDLGTTTISSNGRRRPQC